MKRYTDKELARGREKLRTFEDFRRRGAANAWPYIETLAADMHEQGKAISGRHLIEATRRADLTDKDGQALKLNNNHAAIITRVLIIEHPEYAGDAKLRASVLDVLLPIPKGGPEDGA